MTIIDILCPWLTIRRQRRTIDELQAKAQHTADILANPSVTGMKVAQQQLEIGLQQLEIGLQGPMCEYVAAIFAGLALGCPEAENYLELGLHCSKGRFTVIVTRPDGGLTPHELRKRAEADVATLRGLLAQSVRTNILANQSLEVLEALAELAANGERGQPVLTIAPDRGFGSATLTAPDGSHTHIGKDCCETRDENLALFILGLRQQLVQGCGLSWAPAAPTTNEESIDG